MQKLIELFAWVFFTLRLLYIKFFKTVVTLEELFIQQESTNLRLGDRRVEDVFRSMKNKWSDLLDENVTELFGTVCFFEWNFWRKENAKHAVPENGAMRKKTIFL